MSEQTSEMERLARVAYGTSWAGSIAPPRFEKERERWEAIISAVLEAMKEPTDGMLFDAIETTDEFGSIWPDMPAGGNPADISKAVWQAMLSSILAEKTAETEQSFGNSNMNSVHTEPNWSTCRAEDEKSE